MTKERSNVSQLQPLASVLTGLWVLVKLGQIWPPDAEADLKEPDAGRD